MQTDTIVMRFLRSMLMRETAEATGAAGSGTQTTGDGEGGEGATGSQTATPPTGSSVPQGEGAAPTQDGAQGGDQTLPESYAISFQNEELAGLGEDFFAPYQEAYRELGFSQEQVDKLVSAEEQIFGSIQEQVRAAREAQSAQWLEAAQADNDLGANWDLTLQRVGAGLQASGLSEDEIGILESAGLTNMPGLIKAFSMLGQMTSGDRFDVGTPAEPSRDTASSWYGKTTPAKRG